MRIDELHSELREKCEKAGVDAETVSRVQWVLEELSLSGSTARSRLHFSSAVFRDGIVLMLRDTADHAEHLDERRQTILREHASTWSTVGGSDGRTLCFEIPRDRSTLVDKRRHLAVGHRVRNGSDCPVERGQRTTGGWSAELLSGGVTKAQQ
jgi:hypothetical protein